jgi:hypothetical protein
MAKKTKATKKVVQKAPRKCATNPLVGNFPIKTDAGAVKFPVRPDGSLMIGGRKTSPDMSQDVNKYVKKGN